MRRSVERSRDPELPLRVPLRRSVSRDEVTLVECFVRLRFPDWVPSPIKEVLRVKRLGRHFGAVVVLFDDVRCRLLVEGPMPLGEDRWVNLGMPREGDAFFFHGGDQRWMRFAGTNAEARALHGPNLT